MRDHELNSTETEHRVRDCETKGRDKILKTETEQGPTETLVDSKKTLRKD